MVPRVSLKLAEARARSAVVSDVHTRVHLDLTGDDTWSVEAEIRFTSLADGASTFLEFEALEVSVEADPGVEHGFDGRRVHLHGLAAGQHTVRVRGSNAYRNDGDGMTAVDDPVDGARYVCAYTAMDIAQKVLPCFDQPDLKTTFEVEVRAPEAWTVLANGRLAGHEPAGEGARRWRFEQVPPISSYLFFVAAGPWVSHTWTLAYPPAEGGRLDFGWHAPASKAAALDREIDWLKEVTEAGFRHYTGSFNAPYPFADYQQVFSPGLNWGAMEFPGCVSFRDEYLTPDEPTTLQRQGLSSVIDHEMAHMWFGDLVTMRWWEDTWLNESFADYMGYQVSGRTGFSDGWTFNALTRKPTAYAADSRRSTHPVAEDAENLVDVDTAFANFDMITYAKGNAVLRQLVTWLGEEDFLAGVNAHLDAHAFGNATLADFLAALDAHSDRDVRGWARSWLRSTGFDHVTTHRDGDVTVLTRRGSRPHRFTVTGYDSSLQVVAEQVVDLADEPVRLEELAGLTVLPNSLDETYARLDLDDVTWRRLSQRLGAISHSLHRAVVWTTAVARVGTGTDPVADLVALAAHHLGTEQDPTVFEGVLGLVTATVRSHARPEEVPALLEVLADLARRVLAGGPVSHRPVAGRLLATSSTDSALLRAWLQSNAEEPDSDQELRWAMVLRVAELDGAEQSRSVEELIAAELLRDPSNAGSQAALRARSAVPTHAAKAEAWQRLTSGELSNRDFVAVAGGMWGLEQAALVQEWVQRAPADLAGLAHRSGQAMGQLIGRALPDLPLGTRALSDLTAALADVLAGDVPTVAARSFNDRLDDRRAVLAARGQR